MSSSTSPIRGTANKAAAAARKVSSETEGGSGAPSAQSKLVFGLSSRTNRNKHAEYAEQRLMRTGNSNSNGVTTNDVDDAELIGRAATAAAKAAERVSPVRQIDNPTSSSSKPTSTTNKRKVPRASKYGNFYKPQDLTLDNQESKQQHSKQTKSSPQSDNKQSSAAKPIKVSTSISTIKLEKTDTIKLNSTSQPGLQSATTATNRVRSRSSSPDRTKMVRRKSLERPSAKADEPAATTTTPADNDINSNQVGGAQPKRQQFNILPPPQLSKTTTSSAVSYAKARIYDRPQQPVKHQSMLGWSWSSSILADLLTSSASSGSLIDYWNDPKCQLNASIVSGFKPPKQQVSVSKAREQWEGGEPFAKCKSRKRLAAKLSNSNRRNLLHGVWSMTSVVATQQLQFQQALAQSQAQRPQATPTDPSVKLLSRGSVLERIQQYERAPGKPQQASNGQASSSSLSSGSRSPSSSSSYTSSSSSSSSSLYDDDLYDQVDIKPATTEDSAEVEAEIAIDTATRGATSKRAQYKTRVSSIQQQDQQKQQSAAEQASEPTIKQQQQQQRRRSSSSSTITLTRQNSIKQNSSTSPSKSASSIPKFYHPNGAKPNTYELEVQKRNICACFDQFPDRKAQVVGPASRKQFHSIALACGFSEYFKVPLNLYVKFKLEQSEIGAELSNGENTQGQLNGLVQKRKSSTATGLQRKLSTQNSCLAPSQTNGTTTATNTTIPTTKLDSSTNNNKPTSPLVKAASIDGSTTNATSTTTRRRKLSIIGNTSFDCDIDLRFVSCEQFLVLWRQLLACAYDNPAKFIHLLTFGQRDYLLPSDFVPLIQSIIDDHAGLKFLKSAPDFHMRYIQTVIARIYFCLNKSWTGKISLQELRRSNLLAVLQVLSQEEDINQITDYFSYEHFYVIYCKFWNLDQDHDLLISREDLARHQDASISSRIIERIFSSSIVSRQIQSQGKMNYSDFVWFLIAEEDKKHPRSIEYWFRLMDLDGDGYISMYEMEYFYYEQLKRLELMNIEALPFQDSACQILDLINPKERNKISLSDLKRQRHLATIFFDTFINLEKYLERESREFVSTRDIVQDGVVISDWDRYASEEYENLVTEESAV